MFCEDTNLAHELHELLLKEILLFGNNTHFV